MTATILVVDDEPDLEALVLQKFRRQIREGTVAFVFAHDGIEALASIEANPDVDMVVSDINMPRMDGLSLLQKLQEAASELQGAAADTPFGAQEIQALRQVAGSPPQTRQRRVQLLGN